MNDAARPAGRLQRILFCTDFSESADAAFDFALEATLRQPAAKLHVLHVIHEADAQFWKSYSYEVDDTDAEARKTMDQKVATTYLARVPPGLAVSVEFRTGPEAATILEFARSRRIDLIVLGRHGHGGVGRALFGSVAEKVVRKAECAVLVVPLSYAQRAPEHDPDRVT
jgi:nucleotide-binding universal stress UspA family protein